MLPLSSGIPPSAPRTGQVAFTTSGAPTPADFRHFRIVLCLPLSTAYCCPLDFRMPGILDPFALCPAFPDSLGGRDSTDYYGSAAPTNALATYPPILLGSLV